jgi:membrane protease YdiL (CAAX protease family)
VSLWTELGLPLLAWLGLAIVAGVCFALWWWTAGAGRQPLPPAPDEYSVPWSGGEVWFALLAFFAWPALTAQVLSETGFFGWFYGPGETPPVRHQLWLAPLVLPLFVGSVAVTFRLASGTRLSQLGLSLRAAGRQALAGYLVWLVLTPPVLVIYYLALTWTVGESHPLAALAQEGLSPVEWLLLLFQAIVAASVLEELLCRGVLLLWLARRPWGGAAAIAGALALALLNNVATFEEALKAGQDWHTRAAGLLKGLRPALFIVAMVPGYLAAPQLVRRWLPNGQAVRAIYGTALAFGAAHTAWPSPIPLFVLGLGLGWLAYHTHSLVGPIVAHTLFNLVGCVVLLMSHPTPPPTNGSDVTSAAYLVPPASTSTAVPGRSLPRRTYASATAAPSRGDTTDDVTCPTSLPSRQSLAPRGSGSSLAARRPRSVRLTWPRSRMRTIGSWPK